MDTECGHYKKSAYSLVTFFTLPSVQASTRGKCVDQTTYSVLVTSIWTPFLPVAQLLLRELIVVTSLTGLWTPVVHLFHALLQCIMENPLLEFSVKNWVLFTIKAAPLICRRDLGIRKKLGMVVSACYLSTGRKPEAGGLLQAGSVPVLHSKFQANQGFRPRPWGWGREGGKGRKSPIVSPNSFPP